MKLVFDTYAWIEYFLGSEKGNKVKEFLENKNEIITPSLVLLELSAKSDRESWNFSKQLNYIKLNSKIIGFSDDFILNFGDLYNKTKLKIKQIGLVDCVVLMTALLNEAKVITGDLHFSNLDNVILLK